jgi:hypothetical protein
MMFGIILKTTSLNKFRIHPTVSFAHQRSQRSRSAFDRLQLSRWSITKSISTGKLGRSEAVYHSVPRRAGQSMSHNRLARIDLLLVWC